MISGSSGDAARQYVIALVTNVGGNVTVRELLREYAPVNNGGGIKTTEVTADMLAGITEAAVVYIYTVANCNTYAVGYDPVPAAPAKVDKVWDFSSAAWVDAMTGTGYPAGDKTNTTLNIEVEGLKVVAGGSSYIWNKSGDVYFWQPGGAGADTKRYFEFTTDVAGTVTVYSSNTGSSNATDRFVTVKVGDGEEQSLVGGTPSNEAPTMTEFNIGAGTVKVYPTGNGLRFYKIEFHSK